MQVHARARLSPIGRRRVVERVLAKTWSVAVAAEAAGVTERTIYRWLARFRDLGQAGLVDRPPVACHQPRKTPPDRVGVICALRRLHMTAAEIAECLSMPLSTVSAVLLREGLGKRSRLARAEPPNRYERRRPGELVHIDIKKLGRIIVPGHAITGNRRQRAGSTRVGSPTGARSASPAGSSCTSPSTTTPGWPTPRSWATRPPPAPSPSCAARWRSSRAMASPCSAS
jgi:transposase